MKVGDLQVGTQYALGTGDIRDHPWRFRRVEYLRRATPRYDEFNRTKRLNPGRVMVRFLDDAMLDPDRNDYFRRHITSRVKRDYAHYEKGAETEVDPIILQWTWTEFESHVGRQLRERQAEDVFLKEVTTFFAELGITEKRMNLGRHSIHYNHGESINMMYGNGDMAEISMPYRVFRKLVAGTEITEEDWKTR